MLGENINIWDNHASVIGTACQLYDRGKVLKGTVEVGGRHLSAWMVAKPKGPEAVDAAPAQ